MIITQKKEFIDDIEGTFKDRPLFFMDLGCAGGALVKDVQKRGHVAIGLEGSDYNAKTGRAEWPELHNFNLFTCDISREYSVYIELENGEKRMMQCDVITACEVVEHIPSDRLTVFFDNIRRHLKVGGHFYAGICMAESQIGPFVYHHSVFKKDVWKNEILNKLPGLALHDYPYPADRANHYDPNSFYIMLERVG